mmetsp:Transcript_75518/g.133388  ORF Transcript_75518/g.133388 Transcript_75518/m.133388 type:complete len:89 (+) Transcript_75518:216-482(+)
MCGPVYHPSLHTQSDPLLHSCTSSLSLHRACFPAPDALRMAKNDLSLVDRGPNLGLPWFKMVNWHITYAAKEDGHGWGWLLEVCYHFQ